jgi:hypothetical protein
MDVLTFILFDMNPLATLFFVATFVVLILVLRMAFTGQTSIGNGDYVDDYDDDHVKGPSDWFMDPGYHAGIYQINDE